MGFDTTVRTTTIAGNEDRRWLGTRMGWDQNRSIMLDVSSFSATHLLNGVLPSGTVLGKITASGKYGPYDNGASDGREVAAGFLFSTTRISTGEVGGDLATAPDVGVAMYWGPGVIKESKLPAFAATTGKLDTTGRTDLAHFIRFEA